MNKQNHAADHLEKLAAWSRAGEIELLDMRTDRDEHSTWFRVEYRYNLGPKPPVQITEAQYEAIVRRVMAWILKGIKID